MTALQKATVLIVEDHPDFRNSLAQALTAHPDIGRVDCCNDLPQGHEWLDNASPDVLLVDLGLPSGSGLSLIRKAQSRRHTRCTAAVLTVTGKEADLMKSIVFGAKGYLFKSDTAEGWCTSVALLASGQSPLHAGVAQAMQKALCTGAPSSGRPSATALGTLSHQLLLYVAAGYLLSEAAQQLGLTQADAGAHLRHVYDAFYQDVAELTPREQELLELINRGFTYKQAAQLMNVAESTVKSLSARIYQRLGASNLQMAVYEARQRGLLA